MDALARAVFAAVSEPLWIVDRDHVLTDFNPPFAHLCDKVLHVAPAAPIALDDLLDPLRHHKANLWWRDLAGRVFAGRNVTADIRIVVDGIERYFAISGTPVFCKDGEDIRQAVFTARDVTGAGREERDDLLELAVTRIFAVEKPLEKTLDEVLEFVCESDGWDCGVMWLVDGGSGKSLEPAAFWSRPGIDVSRFQKRITDLRFTRGRGIPGKAWAREEIVWLADLFDESGYLRAEVAAHAGLHGVVAVPLFDSERVVGVMEMLTRAVRPISEQRHRALTRAGKSLGRLIVRRQLQETIERKGQEWSLTFDAIELPVFITRADGAIVRVNRAARDLAGGEFHEVLGRNIAIEDAEPWKTLADCVAAVRDSGGPCSAQITEGERNWDVSGSSYASDEEQRVILMMRDTTEIVHLEESVRRGEQMAALGELVAGVAHEVRNPIFGIGLTVDALQQMIPVNPDVEELLAVLRTWLARLNRLMENLLAYGKSWTLVLERGELSSVLNPVVEGCRQIASQSSVFVMSEVESGLMMLMDANRLGHAFENLIINAIQHSRPQQSVLVTARGVREDGREMIECSVRDHGPGFDPVELPRIFQPFFTKRRGGTGLGLSIVQRVVDEHGGTITAGNAADGGALVTIRFPVYRAGHGNAE